LCPAEEGEGERRRRGTINPILELTHTLLLFHSLRARPLGKILTTHRKKERIKYFFGLTYIF
jgi:hypothetical protein